MTVSYDSARVLRDMLRSVGTQADCVVVDNGGSEPLDDLADGNRLQLVKLPRNEGFGRGCNAGARLARGEYILFLNPDAQLSPGSIAALEAAADALPDFAAANPALRDGSDRAYLKTSSVLLPKQSNGRIATPQAPMRVPVLSGCALFVSKQLFDKVGGFDPAIFLYHEDHDLALRLAEHGSLWCIPQAMVRHVAGTGAPRTPEVAWIKGYHMARSRHFVLHKHRRALPFLRTLAPALGNLLLPQNLLSARRRSRTLGQVAGALSSVSDRGGYVAE